MIRVPHVPAILAVALILPVLAGQACGQVGDPNSLCLNVPGSVYIRPGDSIAVNMDASNLQQPVSGCQTFLSFSSAYFCAGPGDVSVAAGGGVWDQLIWGVWNSIGELDTAVGIDLDGPTGTTADATVARIVLRACPDVEGTTSVVFRPDADPDPYLVASTLFASTDSNAVWPHKTDSPVITIDGTAPAVRIVSVSESGIELSGGTALQGTVSIKVTADDPLHGGVASGLAAYPGVSVTCADGTVQNATFISESPAKTFNYTWEVTSSTPNGQTTVTASASDRAGNISSDAVVFSVSKNRISGTIAMDTLRFGVSASYSFDRLVTFKATNSFGALLQTWLVTVHFVNNTTTGVASGQYELCDVTPSIASLSAKTDWSIRARQPIVVPSDGQAAVDFVGAAKLLGGDLTTDNLVNISDYQTLLTNWLTTSAAADINGDGVINVADFNIMKVNWFRLGSPI